VSIAKNLRQLRLNSGMTQEQAADRLGVTRQTLSSYESERTRPDIDMLMRLCALYGTDLDGIIYGQARALKYLRIIKRIALGLFDVIAALTALSSALLWSANRFYAIEPGVLTPEKKIIFESHVRLTTAWEAVDSVILKVVPIGFLVLLVLLAAWKCRIPLKTKLVYLAAFAGVLLVLAALFGITDAVFAPIDYLITPMLAVARTLVLFAIHLLIDFIQQRRRKQAKG